MRRLFVLRPQPGATATAERARALGLNPVVAPLFAIEPIAWDAPDESRFDALLLTSANAPRHAGAGLEKLLGLPAHAVGAATAEAAREAGLQVASIGGGDARRLLDSLEPELRLLHLCGEHRRLPEEISQPITSLPVYRAVALPRPGLLDGLPGHVALVHSPRAAARLAELVPKAERRRIAVAAISHPAAEAAGAGWATVAAAESPDDAPLLALAARLCDKAQEQ